MFKVSSDFTRQEVESGPAPLAVLVTLEVVLVIFVIVRDALVPVLVAGILRETVAGCPLAGLSHAGPMVVTEEDRRWRRRRQLRALKATLKVPSQERLYRACLRRAWKTERETRSCDQSTTSFRSYDIIDPLSVLISAFLLRLCFRLVSPFVILASLRFSRRPCLSLRSVLFHSSYRRFSLFLSASLHLFLSISFSLLFFCDATPVSLFFFSF